MYNQRAQYQEFIAGTKPLCVLEQRKDAETFELALHHATRMGQYDHGTAYHVHIHTLPEGIELVLAREFKHITHYLFVLNNVQGWREHGDVLRRELGTLFGYDSADVALFVRHYTPEFCECSKCAGVARAIEVLSE